MDISLTDMITLRDMANMEGAIITVRAIDKIIHVKREQVMSEVQGLPVAGYQAQPREAIDAVNNNKHVEENLLRLIDQYAEVADIDKRWLAVARTHIEQGFMAMNRAIFKPGRVVLPGDPE